MKLTILKLLKDNKSILLFLALMCVFRSAVADWNVVPTGSMNPTIIEGDRILVNKLAYDVQVPFIHQSLIKLADPARGDIIVFNSAVSEVRLVKRVVGLPGDKISLYNNVLYINGEVLSYENISSSLNTVDRTENLLGINHAVRLNVAGSRLSNFDEVKVPEGFYLALGDNRDRSADSRVIGFIPRDEIIGQAKRVVMSLNYDNFYIPRSDRFWHSL